MKRPFYRRKVRRKRKVIFLILTLFLLGGIFYSLFFSQIFRIEKFLISGGRSIDSDQLGKTISSFLSSRWFVFTANNFFILKEAELEEIILSEHRRIEGADIQKKFPNSLKIEIKEKNLNLIWCQKESKDEVISEEDIEMSDVELPISLTLEERKCFYLDQNGMVFGKPFGIDLENLEKEKLINSPFILVEEEGRISNLEERIVAPELVYSIFQIKTTLPKIAGLRMTKGNIVPNSAGEIHIETEEGWQVYFDTTRDITSQVKVLDLVLREKITKEEREALEYIDLRVRGRIYYK